MFVQEPVNVQLEGNTTGFLCLLTFIVRVVYDKILSYFLLASEVEGEAVLLVICYLPY